MESRSASSKNRECVNLIRHIELEDVQEVSITESQIFGSEAYSIIFLRQAYELYPKTFFVASVNGGIIGYCMGATVSTNKYVGWILSLGVSSNHRQHGYGSALISKTLDALQDIGCDEVLLTVKPGNNIAKKLFKKYGFDTTKIDDTYFGMGQPREIMHKSLK